MFHFESQGPVRKAYYHDVEALELLAKWLGLEDCQYSAVRDQNGLYLGCVQMSWSNNPVLQPAIGTTIQAKSWKKSITKAHNAAAREAIYFLEDNFNVEIAGINHTSKIRAEEEMHVWKFLKEEVLMHGADVLRFWADMVSKVENQIELQKENSNRLALAGKKQSSYRTLLNDLT